jgi:hypothetical protein
MKLKAFCKLEAEEESNLTAAHGNHGDINVFFSIWHLSRNRKEKRKISNKIIIIPKGSISDNEIPHFAFLFAIVMAWRARSGAKQ